MTPPLSQSQRVQAVDHWRRMAATNNTAPDTIEHIAQQILSGSADRRIQEILSRQNTPGNPGLFQEAFLNPPNNTGRSLDAFRSLFSISYPGPSGVPTIPHLGPMFPPFPPMPEYGAMDMPTQPPMHHPTPPMAAMPHLQIQPHPPINFGSAQPQPNAADQGINNGPFNFHSTSASWSSNGDGLTDGSDAAPPMYSSQQLSSPPPIHLGFPSASPPRQVTSFTPINFRARPAPSTAARPADALADPGSLEASARHDTDTSAPPARSTAGLGQASRDDEQGRPHPRNASRRQKPRAAKEDGT